MRRMMVEIPIPPKWKQLWDTWELRGLIILSLSLQTFLILVAPLRKRTKSNWIIMPLWFAYLLADWTANFAIGLISSSQLGNPSVSSGKEGGGNAVRNEDLLAFWAPFLLVHLGGPETITAFALEDNEFWLRHLLGLVFQCLATVYVFVLSLPQNRLWIPTMLMFLTGIIKYAERTRSFYLASVDRFKDSLIQKDFAKLSAITEMNQEPAKSANMTTKGNLTELEVVQYAYGFFEKFKGVFFGMSINRSERMQSQDFFLNQAAKDAFKLVEVELNFIYEVLYTKLPVVYSYFGAMSRSFSLATVCSAIVLFMFKNKSNLSSADVTITYVLLFGALALDIIALFMLLFSDWTIISFCKSPDDEQLDNSIKTRILRLMIEATLGDPKDDALPNTSRWPIRVFKRRWSESISTFNLIDYCLHQRGYLEEFVYKKLGSSGFLDDIKYVKTKKFTAELRDLIFQDIKIRLELAADEYIGETAMQMLSPRGDWGLEAVPNWSELREHLKNMDYKQSILLWHIATELCYNNELRSERPIKANKDHRDIAKLLSDYMLYLLIMQPSTMLTLSETVNAQILLRAVSVEAKNIFEKAKGREVNEERKRNPKPGDKEMNWKQIDACSKILALLTEPPPPMLTEFQSNSFLFDACVFAKRLEMIEEIEERKEEGNGLDKWVVLSRVWVELLCYGAMQCQANTQPAQVSRGGELITTVWLLMFHFAFDDPHIVRPLHQDG